MGAAVEVRVTGDREAAAAFRRLAGELQALDLDGVGDLAQQELSQLSPRLTGALAASWSVSTERGRVEVGTDLPYAPVQNSGGYHGITGSRFLERTGELVTDRSGRLVSSEIDALIARM